MRNVNLQLLAFPALGSSLSCSNTWGWWQTAKWLWHCCLLGVLASCHRSSGLPRHTVYSQELQAQGALLDSKTQGVDRIVGHFVKVIHMVNINFDTNIIKQHNYSLVICSNCPWALMKPQTRQKNSPFSLKPHQHCKRALSSFTTIVLSSNYPSRPHLDPGIISFPLSCKPRLVTTDLGNVFIMHN